MKVKTLIEYLSDLPENDDVCLSKLFLVDNKDDKEDCYEVRLDMPVVGIAHDDKSKDCIFMIVNFKEELDWYKENLGQFKKVK